jgi:TonB family protein
MRASEWDRVAKSLERGRIASAWALSVAVHIAVASGGAVLVATSLSERPASELARARLTTPESLLEVELPEVSAGFELDVASESPDLVTPPRGGGEAMPRPDSGRAGRGGTDEVGGAATNLADRDDRVSLTRDVLSHFDRTQLSRIDAGRERRSREDRRASREPMELTFLADGEAAARRERRPAAASDPRAGVRGLGQPAHTGSSLGLPPEPPGLGRSQAAAGSAIRGGPESVWGAGVRDGQASADARDSAELAFARPFVDRQTPSVPANDQGRPSDTLDSEQEVALAMQSIVHASTAGGVRGDGRGGSLGPGPTGSGGQAGPGSHAKALGDGKGPSRDSLDRRRTDYLLEVMRKINPLWQNAFPRWAALEGLQGTAIIGFTIRSDGSVEGAVVARSSGVPEFDENVRQAVLRGAPYGRLPSELGPALRWQMPFTVKNPAVRPFDPETRR